MHVYINILVFFNFLIVSVSNSNNGDSLAADVLLGERDVLDQHGRLRAEEDSQHRLEEKSRADQHEAPGFTLYQLLVFIL